MADEEIGDVMEDIDGSERDSEVLRSEIKLPRYDRVCEKRRLVEEKLAQRKLEQQIQDYDF